MKTLLGNSPITSLVGYAIAVLSVVDQALKDGETNWLVIVTAILTAILGRKAADASKVEEEVN